MTESENEVTPNEPNDGGADSFINRAKGYLLNWPAEIRQGIHSPASFFQTLPDSGNWEKPLVYAVSAGLLASVLTFFSFFRMGFISFSYLFRVVIPGGFASIIGMVIGLFLGALFVHACAFFLGKAPQYYKSIAFVSTWMILAPVGQLLGFFVPMLVYAPGLFYLYQLYIYLQEVSSVEKKKAQILVGVLTGLTVLSMLSVFYVSRKAVDYRDSAIETNEKLKDLQEKLQKDMENFKEENE